MVGRAKGRNKAEQERIDFVKQYMSCLPCILTHLLNSHCDYHHVVQGFRRLGHLAGYGMCSWHHRGEPWTGMLMIDMAMSQGPSMAHGKKAFEKYFGSELLLIKAVDFAHELFLKSPWNEFAMPDHIGEEIRNYYQDLQAPDRKGRDTK